MQTARALERRLTPRAGNVIEIGVCEVDTASSRRALARAGDDPGGAAEPSPDLADEAVAADHDYTHYTVALRLQIIVARQPTSRGRPRTRPSTTSNARWSG